MTPLLALAHPGLLWTGLALISVPVLIHLFFRRRHRVVRWAAMDFLLAALKKQKRRIQVENLLLLLLRCAIIAFLALALARPAVKAAALSPFGGGARAVVLVIDTSASMGAQHTGRRSIDRAREKAGQILGDLSSDSVVTLIVTRDDMSGGAPRALLENASPTDARARLAALRVSHGPNFLAEVFRLAGRKLDRLSGRRLVVFLTDLQERDWRAKEEKRNEDLYRALRALRREGDEEPPGLAVLDVGMPGTANVVVTDFTMDEDREAFAGTLTGLKASLVHYGPREVEGTLSLYKARTREGTWEPMETRRVSIRPTKGVGTERNEVLEQFYLDLPEEGPARLKLAFEAQSGTADRLPVDSQRYLALVVKPPVRFLPVIENSSAIEIVRDVQVDPVIEFADPVFAGALATMSLDGIHIVLWADADMHELLRDERIVRNLEAFVRRGGGLLAYVGTDAIPEGVNRMLYREDRSGLFPARLVPGKMDVHDDHPVFIDLDETEARKEPLFFEGKFFGSPAVLGYRRLTDVRDEDVRARYDTDDGDPAVLSHELGNGRVLLVTMSPDERDFRLNGSLLPAIFFFNAAHYLVRGELSHLNVGVGRPIKVPLPPGSRQVVVEPPEEAGGRTEEPVAEEAGKTFVFGETAFPGFYRATVKGVTASGGTSLPTSVEHVAAVNVDAEEGDLRRIPARELQRNYQGTNLRLTEEVGEVFPRAAASGEGELSRALLGCVVFLLFLELVLAWRFGSRRREA